jgi:hypothetical protein
VNWWLILAIVVGIPAAIFLLNFLLGAFLPKQVTGEAWLRKRLKEYGLRDAFPSV